MIYNFENLVEIVKSKVSLKRFTHTIGVVNMGIRLAEKYGADVEKVKIAALLHDICKEMDKDEMKKICRENFSADLSEEDLENIEILHSFVGSYWVEKKLNIENKEIIRAIKNHTLGNKNMTLIEKIIYIADAIEMGRNYPSVEEIRELTFKNLDAGILLEVEKKESYLKSIGKKTHKNTAAMIEELSKKIDL